jgi:hypothetical protein
MMIYQAAASPTTTIGRSSTTFSAQLTAHVFVAWRVISKQILLKQ